MRYFTKRIKWPSNCVEMSDYYQLYGNTGNKPSQNRRLFFSPVLNLILISQGGRFSGLSKKQPYRLISTNMLHLIPYGIVLPLIYSKLVLISFETEKDSVRYKNQIVLIKTPVKPKEEQPVKIKE